MSTSARGHRQDAAGLARGVRRAAARVSALAGGLPRAHGRGPGQPRVAGPHLEARGESSGHAGLPDVVSGGEPDGDQLVGGGPGGVQHLETRAVNENSRNSEKTSPC